MHATIETCSGGVKPVRESTAHPALPARVRAVVTGTGLLTPLGLSPDQTWSALLAGRTICDHSVIPLPDPPAGEPRVNQLAIAAARQAVGESGWMPANLADDRTALVVGTSKGPIESWLTPLPRLVGERNVYGLADVATGVAADLRFGRGARVTVSAACATGLHALIRGTMLIETRQADRVLVVAAESSLGPLFTGSFKRLGVLARDGACRPFDRDRSGFLMSEGAAAVCLEAAAGNSPPAEVRSGAHVRVAIESYALGADATHLTGGDREGQTLRRLIDSVLAGRPVDFIHAHGTGTEVNDATELAAIDAALASLPASRCPMYSHKAALGHSLGAAGLTATVLTCFSHRLGLIPPNPHTEKPIATGFGQINFAAVRRPIQRSLVIAAGFGGAAAAVTLRS